MLVSKLRSIGFRVLYIFRMLPLRLSRLIAHMMLPIRVLIGKETPHQIINGPFEWIVGWVFYTIDILGIPEVYEILFELVKWNLRDANEDEKRIINSIFGKTIDHQLIRIDERAVLGPKQFHFAYVSFHTINSYGGLSRPIFVHELVHVWQYHMLGSIYTFKALKAQRSKEGYYYGGFRRLYFDYERRKPLLAYNFEQQAEIIMDGFKYYQKLAQKRIQRDEIKELVYAYYMDQVLNKAGYDYAINQIERRGNRRL